ncbi:MAG: inositol monophosphatase, partial [Desulfobacteraceae bacterium]
MFSNELEIGKQAALEAGKILEGLFGRLKKIEKKGEIDLVTEADLQSEKVIVDLIKAHFPQDSILTEEGSGQSRDNDRVWIIDPLDGTTNFAHSFPFFAVSIGLEVKKEMVLGIVFNPRMSEFFEAMRGQGAFLNQKPIRVSNCTGLRDALVATGFPYDIHQHSEAIMARFKNVMSRAQGVRRPGAASIDLCYVA